jgi:glutamine---fructose-6-phosphate transaminase (isomerizing)
VRGHSGAVFDNGAIENFKALRDELSAKDRVFVTETDSETAAFAVEHELAKGQSPLAGAPLASP